MKTIPCPRCKQDATLSAENTFRPFCSQRCKDGDFIGWSQEENRIPGSADANDLMSADLTDY